MLKAMKSYWAFTRTGYKTVVLLLLPLIALGNTLGFMAIEKFLIVIALILSFVILWTVEPMSDHWFMGGMYGKNKGALEFMQSSNRFSSFMKDVVLVDIIRRAGTHLSVYLIICMIGYANGVEKEMEVNLYVACSFLPFLSMFVSQVEALIGRHFDMWNQRYFVVMVGFIIEGITLSSFIKLFLNAGIEMVWIVNGVLFVLFVIVAIGTVAYTNKKVRESYYDK